MMGQMKRREYHISEVKEYILEALDSGKVDAYLVPAVSFDGEYVSLTTYYEGYITADRISFTDILQLVNMLIKVIDNLIDAENHLIYHGCFNFEASSVFYSPELNDVKLEFSFCDEGRDLDNLFDSLREGYRGSDIYTCERISKYIRRNNPGLSMLKKELVEIKRGIISMRTQSP